MLGKINWKPQPRDIRYFAVTLAIVAVLLGLFVLAGTTLRQAAIVTGAGLALAALCYLLMPVGKAVYLLWMAVSFILGWIVSPVVIGIIYYLVLTPIGLFYRISGRDELRLKPSSDKTTYFESISEAAVKDDFRKQF